MTIGDKIRTLRKEKGFNQTELGERLGVKTNAVSKWECGRVEDIPMSKVKMMASLFGVPVSYLIDDDKEEEKEQPARTGELSEAEVYLIQLFRKLPADLQASYPSALEATLKAQGLL